MAETEKKPPSAAEVAKQGMQHARAVRNIATLFLGGGQPYYLRLAADWIETTAATLSEPICAAELAARGVDERLAEMLIGIMGETLPAETVERLRLTREEQWALGYGPTCPCGEMGMAPDEEVIEVDGNELCSLCARLAKEDSKT